MTATIGFVDMGNGTLLVLQNGVPYALQNLQGAGLFGGSGGSGVSSFNTRTGAVTLTSSDVTTALGFTPPEPSSGNAFVQYDPTTGTLAVPSPLIAEIVMRTNSLANLLTTVGNAGELGVANNVPAVVQFFGGSTAGGNVFWSFASVTAFTSSAPSSGTSSLTISPTMDLAAITVPASSTTLAITLNSGSVAYQKIRLSLVSTPSGLANLTVNGTSIDTVGLASIPTSTQLTSDFDLVWTGTAWVLFSNSSVPASIGAEATRVGPGTVALGQQSVAIGYGAVAAGEYGLAIGFGSSAPMPYSVGINAVAAAFNAFSLLGSSDGDGAVALGYNSAAGPFAFSGPSAVVGSGALGYGSVSLQGGAAVSQNGSYTSAIASGTLAAGVASCVVSGNVTATFNAGDHVVVSLTKAANPTIYYAGVVNTSSYSAPNTTVAVALTNGPIGNVWPSGYALSQVQNVSPGALTVNLGQGASVANFGENAYAPSYNNQQGDGQCSKVMLYASTSAAGAVTMTTTGQGSTVNTSTIQGSSNRFILDTNKGYDVQLRLVGKVYGSATMLRLERRFSIINNGSAAALSFAQTPQLIGTDVSISGLTLTTGLGESVASTTTAATAANAVVITLNTTYGSLDISVYGTSASIDWVASLDLLGAL